MVNARLSWSPARGRKGAPAKGLSLFVAARNLFDDEYATRGIFAFDFSTFQNDIFLTPAPGRRVLGGLEWGF